MRQRISLTAVSGNWKKTGVVIWKHTPTGILVYLDMRGGWHAWDIKRRFDLPNCTYPSRFAAQQFVDRMVA